jgi:hypothetical protein
VIPHVSVLVHLCSIQYAQEGAGHETHNHALPLWGVEVQERSDKQGGAEAGFEGDVFGQCPSDVDRFDAFLQPIRRQDMIAFGRSPLLPDALMSAYRQWCYNQKLKRSCIPQ